MEHVHTLLQLLPALGDVETEHILAWVTLVMSILAIAGWALDLALPWLRARAALTKTKLDDDMVHWLGHLVVLLHMLNVAIPRPTFGRGDEAGGRTASPDGLGPTALFFAFVIAGSVLVQGCGLSQWDVHAAAAQTSSEAAVVGRGIIMGERRRVLLAAGQGAADIAVAVRAAAEVWDGRNMPLVDAYNAFAAAANAYAAAAFAALRGEVDDPARLIVFAGHVADAWNAVAALLEASDVAASLPRIPDWLLRFLSGDPTAQPTAGGAV